MTDPTRAEHLRRLATQLSTLRPVLLAEHGQGFLNFFDELITQSEYELALHALCDFILDPGSPLISESILSQIQDLHLAMEIEDDCIERLRQKLA